LPRERLHRTLSSPKKLLKSIYKAHPEAEENFAAMLGNYQGFQLYFDQIEIEDSLDKRYALRPLLSAEDVLKYETVQRKYSKLLSPLQARRHHIFSAI
jgi:hypothetical protein